MRECVTHLAGLREGSANKGTLALVLVAAALVEHLESLHGSSGTETVGIVGALVVVVSGLVLLDGICGQCQLLAA